MGFKSGQTHNFRYQRMKKRSRWFKTIYSCSATWSGWTWWHNCQHVLGGCCHIVDVPVGNLSIFLYFWQFLEGKVRNIWRGADRNWGAILLLVAPIDSTLAYSESSAPKRGRGLPRPAAPARTPADLLEECWSWRIFSSLDSWIWTIGSWFLNLDDFETRVIL